METYATKLMIRLVSCFFNVWQPVFHPSMPLSETEISAGDHQPDMHGCKYVCSSLCLFTRLFVLALQLDGLVIDKDALAFVRLRLPPSANLCSKLRHNLLVASLKQYSGWLWCTRLDPQGHTHLHGMGEAQFQVDELLTRVLGLLGDCGFFHSGTVTDPNETQNTRVTF